MGGGGGWPCISCLPGRRRALFSSDESWERNLQCLQTSWANPLLAGTLCSPHQSSLGPPERTSGGRSAGERFCLHRWWKAAKEMEQLYISGLYRVRHRRGPSIGGFCLQIRLWSGSYKKVMGRKQALEAAQLAKYPQCSELDPQHRKSKPQITPPFPQRPAPVQKFSRESQTPKWIPRATYRRKEGSSPAPPPRGGGVCRGLPLPGR